MIDGQVIIARGQGKPGVNNGANGNLYLRIQLVPHPLFDVEAHNLVITVPISPWEAALGTKLIIPSLDGKISLKIPANSQSGKKLKIKGHGLYGQVERGDLYAVLKIVNPEDDSDEIKKLWQKMSEKSDFSPRKEWR